MEKMPFNSLSTERLILEPRVLSFDAAKDMFDLLSKNRDFLSPWMKWIFDINSVEDCFISISEFVKSWESMKSADYNIFDKNKILMGSISVFDIDYEVNSGEIGYWIGQEFTKKGYISEAICELEKEFFNRGLERIVIKCDVKNLPSSAVAEKCGYKLDGILRQDDWNPIKTEKRDTKIFSKLKSEWV